MPIQETSRRQRTTVTARPESEDQLRSGKVLSGSLHRGLGGRYGAGDPESGRRTGADRRPVA